MREDHGDLTGTGERLNAATTGSAAPAFGDHFGHKIGPSHPLTRWPNEVLMKCSHCHELKSRESMAVDRNRRTGRRTVCTRCRAAYDRRRHTDQPHIAWESDYRARCRAYGLAPVISSFTREQLVDAWGDTCVTCGGPWEQIDHHIPVAAGGGHNLTNCCPMCARCNGRKRWESDSDLIRAFRIEHAGPQVGGVTAFQTKRVRRRHHSLEENVA